MRRIIITLALAASPTLATAQGLVGGAERGADSGATAAGPVGAVVGGAVGGAVGTVNGVLGVGPRHGCDSVTTRRTDAAGDTRVTKRTDCD